MTIKCKLGGDYFSYLSKRLQLAKLSTRMKDLKDRGSMLTLAMWDSKKGFVFIFPYYRHVGAHEVSEGSKWLHPRVTAAPPVSDSER